MYKYSVNGTTSLYLGFIVLTLPALVLVSYDIYKSIRGLPTWLSGKESGPANAEDIRDMDFIPGLGRSPGGGHGNPFQCSCLENPMDRGAWWATVHGVAKSWTGLSIQEEKG